MDFISVAAAAAAAAADFIPRVAMSRRRDICVCARAYTVPPGRWRATRAGGNGSLWANGSVQRENVERKKVWMVSCEESSHRAADCHVEMWDGGDVPASLEKSNPCASRSSGTSSSASSCDGEETDAKAFDAAESGGEASRQIPRVNRLLFARDLVVACGCATGGPSRTTRARRTRSSLESSDDSLPSVERGV